MAIYNGGLNIIAQDISGKEDKSNKVTAWSSTTTDTNYPSEKLVKDALDAKVSTANALTLEQIQATDDLTGKVASAGALKQLNKYFDYNVDPIYSLNRSKNGFKLYVAAPGVEGAPTSDDYYLVLSFIPVNDMNYGIEIACNFTNQDAYIRRRWSEWGAWKKISN